ncbi:MAG: N-6 DNA methylase, partial [Phycisphaerales bacterium]|nr:N-6 DNA methylase [Phycisphaerales bacterium]
MSMKSPNISDLVQGFARHIKDLKSSETKEATVRQNYIDPFWRALGWDVGDTRQVGPSNAEVVIEKSVETVEATGLRHRRPDYLFRPGGFPRFIVEAKRPSVDIDEDKEAIFQAKQYAWNATIPFAILTDFEQFRLFDTTLKPIFHDPGRGLVREFKLNFDQYEAQWDVLQSTFGRDAVIGGSLEELLRKVKKIGPRRRIRTVDRMLFDFKGSEPVDQVFLAHLDVHRQHFAVEMYRHNKSKFPEADTLHGAARLTEAVQRIMDRLVFMRVCEDRGIVPFGALRSALARIGAEGGDFYEALCKEFREWDRRYNGYLYKPHFSEELLVDAGVLADFVRTLYPPDGPWDFAAIGDDILGIVYERFLGNVVTVEKSHVEIKEKPEVRHAGGVYYTPRFVVDTIIRRVVGPKIQGKTPAQVLDVKILDPACGSGSFLVAALQYLFDYCLSAVQTDPSLARAHIPALAAGGKGRKKKSEIAFQDKEKRWYLAPDFRSALLTHCIHGVDIDQQAVEVTVMSLYLKMLESKLPENWATLWVERQLLPPLDNNVQCGNSLIDEADWFTYCEIQGRNQKKLSFAEEDADTTFRINRFDWTSRTRGFGRLLDSQAVKDRGRAGFDCIIGNPPYIRVQELNKWAPQECEFYKWRYKSAAKGNYDIYVVFTEKALSLLAPDGLLGFIMPHKFWQAKYGEGLRKLIGDGKHLKEVVDFGDQQVFKGATTYTAVHILSGNGNIVDVRYAKIIELEDGRSQCADLDERRQASGALCFNARKPQGAHPWVFSDEINASFLDAVRGNHPTLSQIVDKIAQGIVTSDDEVYFLHRVGKRYKSLA